MAKTQKKKPAKPRMDWQTGDYQRRINLTFILPYQFLLICRLMDVTPEKVIHDFTENLACGSWNREDKDKAKQHLINYFIECGYGRHYYTEEEIRQMFTEMDALGMLFPHSTSDMQLVEMYSNWRERHHTWWFEKWYHKARRKPISNET